MEQMKTLGEIIANLSEFDPDETIYATEPWTEKSTAIVAMEPEDADLPEEAIRAGMAYLLEIFIALEVIEDWLPTQDGIPTSTEICNRVIEYAINDA